MKQLHRYNYKYQYLYGQREKLYNPNVPELDNGISNQYNSSYSKDYATEGWLFRVQYDYDGKYFGSASYRRDASSRLASIRIIVGATFGLSVQVGY